MEYYYLRNPDTTLIICKKAKSLAEKSHYLKGMVDSYAWIAYLYNSKGDDSKALKYHFKSLALGIKLGDHERTAQTYNNIGYLYYHQGNIPKTLEFYHKSLRLREKVDDEDGVALSLINIAMVYLGQGDENKAIEYTLKALAINVRLGKKRLIASCHNNLGIIYSKQGNLNKALEYYTKSLIIDEEIGNKSGIAVSLNNMGNIYERQGDLNKAIANFKKSLKIREEIDSKLGIAESAFSLGNISFELGDLKKAKEYATFGLVTAKNGGHPSRIKTNARLLSRIHEAQGKGMKALEMYKLYVQMKDSVNNEATQKATIRQQAQYEFEKAQIVKENEAKEQARVLAEATGRRNNLQYSLIFLGILVLFVAILMLGFIKVSPNVAEGLIFFAFLILFEFALVFTEPYLEQYTNGEPMYNLLANSVLALLIFPVHSILERLLKKRIVK